MGRLRIPDHRCATAIASQIVGPKPQADRIGQLVITKLGFGLPQLFALIDAQRALECRQHRYRLFGDGIGGIAKLQPAADMAVYVMVGKAPAGPTIRRTIEEAFDLAAEMFSREFRPQHFEAIGHVQAVIAFGIFRHDLDGSVAVTNFAHHGAVVIFVQQGPHPL